ncbi:class I SAM-dependent methyltransferase [Paraburkholderia sp. MMS20-SJTN17]|uniref:Class I SAM-dependent methyltransferase n=1 Tax=Paraburkholderia translucens TaxID=2886945 RepID=A0ABS8K976_9BURK|nr:class I SAM-dependent methyltransferase [Paraburkholderia sp. MMS20-SJTN17]MCC8401222.1 class I SAM-dependent methyltransferase [Paraburkholderia sp. MMS20-SJTN17]
MAKEDNALSIDEIRDKRRCRLLNGLNVRESVGVEIGPLCWPLVRRSDGGEIIYVDHTDTPHLRQKYKDDPHLDINEIVNVDAVWGRNTLHEAIGGRYVDYVVASHVVEHVPDLVTWLRELAAVLKPTGEVRLVVPDRRYTFDYFRRESRLPEVLASYIARARVPQPYSLLDHCLSAADVSTLEAWQKRIDPHSVRRHHTWRGALHLARDAYENGTYHDVHCWVFTPRSFAKLIADLCEMELIDFACEDFHDTLRNDIEFSVVMRRSRDPQYIAESWRRMAQSASDATPEVPFGRARRKLEELRARQDVVKRPRRICGEHSEFDPDEPVTLPPNFDPREYLAANPDVAEAGVDPGSHYQHFGWREGRALRPSSAANAISGRAALGIG